MPGSASESMTASGTDANVYGALGLSALALEQVCCVIPSRHAAHGRLCLHNAFLVGSC